MGKLVYFKWMVEDAKVLKENLTTEQIGELFVAVMDYLQTGTVVEVSKEIRFPYADYRNKVDRACASYDETCSKRAESGKKGGKAKAKNAARAAGEAPDQAKKFKPPTLSQFKNAVKKLVDTDELPCDERIPEYSIEEFYDYLAERNWTINGTPIQSRIDWEKALIAKFYGSDSPVAHFYFWAFCHLFSTYDGFRDSDGATMAESLAYSFIDDFDEDDKRWWIAGKAYSASEKQAALDAYVADWKAEQEESRPP